MAQLTGNGRVLHILPNLRQGGAEHLAVNLCCLFAKRGYEVGLISLYNQVDIGFRSMLVKSKVKLWELDKSLGFDFLTVYRVNEVLNNFRPHVVHSHLHVLKYIFLSLIINDINFVHTVHTVADKEAAGITRYSNKLAFKLGVIPVAIADAVAESFKKIYTSNNLQIIPNGIPVNLYANNKIDRASMRCSLMISNSDIVFICVARFYPEKNHSLLLDAFSKILSKYPDVHLLLVGDGATRPRIEELASGLGNNIHFLGSRSDVPDLLNSADVFVLSSDWEGNPLSVMEAMAAGKPVISTAVGGIPELVTDGVHGLLTPAGCGEQLSKAMMYLIENPDVRIKMGIAAFERANQKFDFDAMADLYEVLYLKNSLKP